MSRKRQGEASPTDKVQLTVPMLRAELEEFGEYAKAHRRCKGRQAQIVLVDRLEAWKRQRLRRSQRAAAETI